MKRIRLLISLLLSVMFSGVVLDTAFHGLGPIPPLGPTFNPATGVWTMALGAKTPKTQSLSVPGLRRNVTVTFDTQGTAFIRARTAHDLFFTIGYLQAKNRLFQMDLMRRQGEGLLSQVVGPAALASDKFELQLGLLRTARTNWARMRPSNPAFRALTAFSAGVNDVIHQDEAHGTLPVMFKLLGYRPAPWTPIDSLVIQGDMTQSLDYTTAPIEYHLLAQSLGWRRTMAWFPLGEPNVQHPYDPGPYKKLPLASIESQTAVQKGPALVGGVPTGALSNIAASVNHASAAGSSSSAAEAAALGDVIAITRAFHHSFSDSNNWAVSGSRTANNQTMMAGDPHLSQTLPAIWYQIAGSAPGYHFSGVSIPGVPLILIGHNQNIAWSLTNVQNQATFLYREKTSVAHPNAYYWKGRWRSMKLVRYDIPVKGHKPVPLTVRLTVHGPLMAQSGQTLAVDWIGALPSNDVQSLLQINRANNFAQFRTALKLWHAPSQNFIYADSRGNIGLISAGYYPEVAQGNPWAVLSGTGRQDIVGTIPFAAIPQAYNPASGFLFSANQREVSNHYPYYIGNAMDFFSTGFRADTIYQTLIHAHNLTPTSFQRLQNNIQDSLAASMVPELIRALNGTNLTPAESQATQLLRGWNGTMSVNSPAATIWWYFIDRYLQATFGPWWKVKRVPVSQDPNLALKTTSTVGTPLVDDLEAWTANDPTNPAFSLPDGTRRSAAEVMRQAFQRTVALLTKKLGKDPNQWQWGKVHFRDFASLTQIPELGYGPRPSGGDSWTVNAADGGLVSHAGPSWRMIVNWQGPGKTPFAESVYPGGQSENPVSPWYENQIPAWWTGHYYRMESFLQAKHEPGAAVWTLTP